MCVCCSCHVSLWSGGDYFSVSDPSVFVAPPDPLHPPLTEPPGRRVSRGSGPQQPPPAAPHLPAPCCPPCWPGSAPSSLFQPPRRSARPCVAAPAPPRTACPTSPSPPSTCSHTILRSSRQLQLKSHATRSQHLQGQTDVQALRKRLSSS